LKRLNVCTFDECNDEAARALMDRNQAIQPISIASIWTAMAKVTLN
jgi:hypothetical protein